MSKPRHPEITIKVVDIIKNPHNDTIDAVGRLLLEAGHKESLIEFFGDILKDKLGDLDEVILKYINMEQIAPDPNNRVDRNSDHYQTVGNILRTDPEGVTTMIMNMDLDR